MDNPRPEKVAVVAEVREKLGVAQAALLADYRGLTVKDLSALREALAPTGATVGIYKNTLVRFAARDLGITDLEPLLTGPTAITFVEGDGAAAAKALRDFSRVNPLLIVKGGLLGSKVVDAGGAKALADLPNREVLLSQIAGLLQAPLQQMASLLDAVPRTFAYGIGALIDKQGGVPDEAAGAAPTDAAPTETATETETGTGTDAVDPAAPAEPSEPTPDTQES
ncbi:MAG: LSU ribosomal protein L10p (P0) [uncultured Acidimicrobiales bacterium]|uniref:Large ribosomal subunit protein uL10 n=1 Tax=uncultured Acidimicrobiales bacterium TaxID=310071 RepID=A0A6J4JB40_9ACTN|nr:MAG: LSU ribosomal protein L10p (P0) [uncultured Acidimicrobiales bacterium]